MLLRIFGLMALTFLPTASMATDELSMKALGADAFSSNVMGKTLMYSKNGLAFGAEEYLPDNHVRWSYEDGQCQEGIWFAQNEQICFVYDGETIPQCWTFFASDKGLIAHHQDDPLQDDVYETSRSAKPLFCKGPEVGA